MSRMAIIVFALGCFAQLAAAGPLKPELEPKSSKKFFNKDYPADQHPVADEHYHFNHPYPAVQDSGDFDKDFVQDENADGGKWQAQMDYDVLRQKVRQAEKELAELKKRMEKEYMEMEDAKKIWQGAVDKVNAAKADTAAAKQEEADAQAKVKRIEDEVHSAASKVEKEVKDLEKCKKALEDAKQRLKELLEKQSALEKEAKAKKEGDAKKAKEEEKKKSKQQKEADTKEKKDADRKKAAEKAAEDKKKAEEKKRNDEWENTMKDYAKKQADYKKKKADWKEHVDTQKDWYKKQKQELADEIAKMKKDKAVWEKKIAEENSEYAEASTAYDKVMQEVHETEAALDKAAENLKKFRRPPHVDNDGGVYNVPNKSPATSSIGVFVTLLTLALSFQ